MATWDRYLSQTTGLELMAYTGVKFTPRFYCDDPDGGVYVTKVGVCKLLVSPLVQFVNTNISWDISQSTHSTGTISTYTIAFGGGGVSDISGASWAGAKTGTVQYNAVGTYTITAYVTDTLSKRSNEVKIQVQIIDLEERVYIGTIDTGCFILTPSAAATASNSGLSGDDLKFRSLRPHPAFKDLPDADQHHLWACTKNGLAYSTDGAATWSTISKATLGTPTNTAGDDPAPATADLDQIDLCFDPQDDRRVYALRTTTSPKRAWLYKSDDYGATWSNTQVSI